MNETLQPENKTPVPWPNGDTRVQVPHTSMLPGSEKPTPAAVGLLNNAVQGAHATLDRFADRATPAVRQLGDTVAAAKDTLHVKADQLRETRDEWAEGMRTTVRRNPLASIAGAFALGAVIARLTR